MAAMTASKAEALYEEVLGPHALDRQRKEAEVRFPCCGERRLDGHHLLCEKYVAPVAVDHPALF